MKDRHREKLEAMLEALRDAGSMFPGVSDVSDMTFRIERKLNPSTCPDCGRKASICANTLSSCRISPNNRVKAL